MSANATGDPLRLAFGEPPPPMGSIYNVTYSSDSITHWPVTLRQAAR